MKTRVFAIEIMTADEFDDKTDLEIGEAFFDDLCASEEYGDYLDCISGWDPVRD